VLLSIPTFSLETLFIKEVNMAQVSFFEKVKVLPVGITGPQPANILFIVTGVAVINFEPTPQDNNDWTRTPLAFLVPGNDGNPLSVVSAVDAACIVYPATFTSANSQDFGWGVDGAATAIPTEDKVEVVATIVGRTNANTILYRVGFHVSILARI
jgi:hypothetical protein